MTTSTPAIPKNAVLDDDFALQELVAQLDELNSIVNQIVRLRSNNVFRFLSKPARNSLIYSLLDKSGAVEDAAKAAFRSIKKTKREVLPLEMADILIAASAGLHPIEINAKAEAETDVE